MSPSGWMQWALGFLGALVLLALAELIVSSRDTDKRIGGLERMQDRHGEAIDRNTSDLQRLMSRPDE